MIRGSLLSLVLLVGLGSAPAIAFDARGHQIIASLAYEQLTPQTRTNVAKLLALAPQEGSPSCPAASFEQAATWADCVRDAGVAQYSELRFSHYQRISLCGVNPAIVCPDGRCLSNTVTNALQVLQNTRTPNVAGLVALEEVEHLIGDMHQPLHTVDAYHRTGTSIQVSYAGQTKPRSLHQIWDGELVDAAMAGGGHDAIERMISQQGKSWTSGSPEDWVQQSHDVGVRYGYQPLGLDGCGGTPPEMTAISQAYIARGAQVEREQIAKASVRLAYVLNKTLGHTSL